MIGEGNYLIVASPFDRPWIAWGGSLDKWGPFGQERRFPTHQEAEACFEDAHRDAEKYESSSVNGRIFVACASPGSWTGTVFHDGNEVVVDFTKSKLYVRQMEELGVL